MIAVPLMILDKARVGQLLESDRRQAAIYIMTGAQEFVDLQTLDIAPLTGGRPELLFHHRVTEKPQEEVPSVSL